MDTDLFFPDSATQLKDTKELVFKMCKECMIYDLCLDYALQNVTSGIWAATDENDRKKIRKQRDITPRAITITYNNVLESNSPRAKSQRKAKELTK